MGEKCLLKELSLTMEVFRHVQLATGPDPCHRPAPQPRAVGRKRAEGAQGQGAGAGVCLDWYLKGECLGRPRLHE